MAKHFEAKHPGMSMPPNLSKVVKLAFHEKALVMQLLTKYKATKVCKGKNCECTMTCVACE